MRTSRLVVVALMAGVVVLAAVGPALAATSVVRAGRNSSGAFVWKPVLRSIAKGDRISWRNPTSVAHNIVAYGGNWRMNRTIGPGQRTARAFKRRGVFRYRCTFHSVKTSSGCTGMCARINVG